MNEVKVFQHEMFGEIRVTDQDGDPWFIAKDVALSLGYKRTADAIREYCKGGNVIKVPSKGGMQNTKIIPESDVYRLIMRSKLLSYDQRNNFVCYIQGITGNNYDIILTDGRGEVEFLIELQEALLSWGFSLCTQKVVNVYKVDGYIPEINMVIEYDENDHQHYDPKLEIKRETIIRNELKNCSIVRVSDSNTNGHNIGIVLKEIMGVLKEKI